MKQTHSLLLGLVFLGAGCVTPPPATPPKPSVECPDVCAAICAGLPEPSVPSGCPLPMCACDFDRDDVSGFEPNGEERACQRDEDCVYADNSTCPFTNAENVVAINKNASESFQKRRPPVPYGTLCIEIFAEPEGQPQCVSGLCTVPGR